MTQIIQQETQQDGIPFYVRSEEDETESPYVDDDCERDDGNASLDRGEGQPENFQEPGDPVESWEDPEKSWSR